MIIFLYLLYYYQFDVTSAVKKYLVKTHEKKHHIVHTKGEHIKNEEVGGIEGNDYGMDIHEISNRVSNLKKIFICKISKKAFVVIYKKCQFNNSQ